MTYPSSISRHILIKLKTYGERNAEEKKTFTFKGTLRRPTADFNSKCQVN